MPKSRKRKKTVKKNKHAKRNPNDGSVYLNPSQRKYNSEMKKQLNS